MTNNRVRWLVLAVVAAAAGAWLWAAVDDPLQVSAALLLATAAALAALWQWRLQSAQRLNAVFDAYVKRALLQEPHSRERRQAPRLSKLSKLSRLSRLSVPARAGAD